MDSFDRQWQRWFPEEKLKPPQPPPRPWTTSRIIFFSAVALALLLLLSLAKTYYTEWLWFNSLNYASVFTTTLKTRISV
ncbi:MAG TPA: hypothetical protein VJK47_04315, partial [Dehalococcoidales bacterium]|nr:hypothetical protein [Dehalococcoidales bacterium]